MCYLDLDGFKAINDSLGHDSATSCSSRSPGGCAACVAGRGHLVARMGGDEFVILVDRRAGTDDAVAVAEAALAARRRPGHVGDHRAAVSASVGIVERPDRGDHPPS